MDPEQLHVSPERHIECNPVLAQFILDDEFSSSWEADQVPEGFKIDELDKQYAAERSELVTRGWRRLIELSKSTEELAIQEFPLPDRRSKWS